MHAANTLEIIIIADTDQPSITEQTEPSTIEQTVPATCSIGIQCDLLAAAPLQKLTSESISAVEESLSTDNEEADLDTSYQLIQEDTTTE